MNWTRGQADIKKYRCRTCYGARNARTNPSANPLRRAYYALAGGADAYYAASPERRATFRVQAKEQDAPSPAVTPATTPALPAITRSLRERVYREEDVEGYVYVVSNPAYPGYVKIGYAGDCGKRLSQFQTGSPYRDYEMLAYAYTTKKREAETWMHELFAAHRVGGEWFLVSVTEAVAALEMIREYDPVAFPMGDAA